jgi:hypothetical protein
MRLEGIPINTSDGYVDLFEIDPGGIPYVEMYTGRMRCIMALMARMRG